jgi:hypothetical protein
MKASMKRFFTFSLSQTEVFIDNQNITETINCPLKEMMCKVHLTDINKSYLESEQLRKEKDYLKSIESLKIAFKKATELMDNPCTKCAQNFRLSIIKSLVNIHDELEELSKGFFGDKNYLPVYLKSVETLAEFKNAKYLNSVQSFESKERFLGNHLN